MSMEHTAKERRAWERPPYNELWCIAFEYAMNSGMSTHRAGVFAMDYARCFEEQPTGAICSPEDFVTISATLDYDYQGAHGE
jgi:hypothetical protein